MISHKQNTWGFILTVDIVRENLSDMMPKETSRLYDEHSEDKKEYFLYYALCSLVIK